MDYKQTIEWLLKGDVSVQYQTWRDLCDVEKSALRRRIATEGWGRRFLDKRHPTGHWGRGFYQPKWTSTHYTLLDLRELCLPSKNQLVHASIDLILDRMDRADSGARDSQSVALSDICVRGMFLNYASFFETSELKLRPTIDFLLSKQMIDGGFNCRSDRGATHSSVHTTLSVLEGFEEYTRNGHRYRLKETQYAQRSAEEFLLTHRLFRSHRSGEIISPKFLRFPHPSRWYYDILRALDYFRYAERKFDGRMEDAIDVIIKKRAPDGLWRLSAAYAGAVHFTMEQAGQPSRWVTLKAMRVLKHFDKL